MKTLELAGKRFGMLLVISRDGNIGKKVAWLCSCDCGQLTRSGTSNLRMGFSTSCGCVRTKHNGKGTRLYGIWNGMKDRCLNPLSQYWERYGGRGITVCEEWRDFKNFKEWSIANGYADTLEIDRKKNDDEYRPGNCRWITKSENAKKGNRPMEAILNA